MKDIGRIADRERAGVDLPSGRGRPTNWEELSTRVDRDSGVMTVPMEALRDLAGFKKLGVHVRPQISKELRGRGLDHLPAELPIYQDNLVRVYRQGSDVAKIIGAVQQPGPSGDRVLREAVAGSDAEEVLARIRDLVCAE